MTLVNYWTTWGGNKESWDNILGSLSQKSRAELMILKKINIYVLNSTQEWTNMLHGQAQPR